MSTDIFITLQFYATLSRKAPFWYVTHASTTSAKPVPVRRSL